MNIKSSPYTKTDSKEREGVTLFEYLVDKNRVKTFVTKSDKTPNIDGYIELTDENQVPIAKLEVQVKRKTKIITKKGKISFSCKKEFLYYCKESILPVLLILVGDEENIIYWKHITRNCFLENLDKLENQGSVTVYLDKQEFISKTNNGYLEQWISIFQDYKSIHDRYEKLVLDYNILLENSTTNINFSSLEVKRIQKILDFTNNFLDIYLLKLKSIYYPNIWKLGLAYYRESIILYAIPYGNADTLIKKITNIDSIIDPVYYLNPEESIFSYNYNVRELSINIIKSMIHRVLSLDNVPISYLEKIENYASIYHFLQTFFANFTTKINCLFKEFFPQINHKIKYYNNFNKIVIVIDNDVAFLDSSINLFYLKQLDSEIVGNTEVYNSSKGLENLIKKSNLNIELNGKLYKKIASRHTYLKLFIDKLLNGEFYLEIIRIEINNILFQNSLTPPDKPPPTAQYPLPNH